MGVALHAHLKVWHDGQDTMAGQRQVPKLYLLFVLSIFMTAHVIGVVNCPQVFMEKSEEKSEEGSHVELLDQIKELVHQLMADPFLNDLSFDISLDELQSQLALEQGHAMTVNVRRLDDVIIRKYC